MLRSCLITAVLFAGLCYANDYKAKRNIGIFNVVKFGNDPCEGSDNKNGTCYTEAECENKGGKASGSCAEGYGVCCVFTEGCGDVVAENGTYFESSGTPTGQCNLKVCKCDDNICQLRLDFMTFVIAGPSTATTSMHAQVNGGAIATGAAQAVNPVSQCMDDQFTVTAPGAPAPPVICGTNTGAHMYVEASEACNTLSFQLSGTASVTRSWAIKVTQYSCDFNNLPPAGCTQWFFGATTGTIQSFNWANKQHLANQNQLICIRRERNTCRVCYSASPTADDDFRLSGMDANNEANAMAKCGHYGADGMETNYDHVIIPQPSKEADSALLGYSGFCGGNLGTDGAANDATICSKKEPFQIRFVTDGFEFDMEATGAGAMQNDKGFSITYNLGNC